MTTDQYLQWLVESMQTFGRVLNVKLPKLPGGVVEPPANTTRTFDSGIEIIGPTQLTSQPRRLRVTPGSTVTFNEPGKLGMIANGEDPWRAGMPYHGGGTPISSHMFTQGDTVVVAKPRTPAAPFVQAYLEEAVLIECVEHPTISLDARWPQTVVGMDQADVDRFLSLTTWYLETREGWSGRRGHPVLNSGPGSDAGYGGLLAERTSLGALLLCSTLPANLKQLVQDRFVLMFADMVRYQITYPADGGHGVGRYIIYLIGKALGLTTSLTDDDFSETQQLTPSSVGYNGVGWRHYITSNVDMSSSYVVCCTANRWGGAAMAAGICPWLNAETRWIEYTRGYLADKITSGPSWHFAKDGRSNDTLRLNRVSFQF